MTVILLHLLFAATALLTFTVLARSGRRAIMTMRALHAEGAAGAPLVVRYTIRASGATLGRPRCVVMDLNGQPRHSRPVTAPGLLPRRPGLRARLAA